MCQFSFCSCALSSFPALANPTFLVNIFLNFPLFVCVPLFEAVPTWDSSHGGCYHFPWWLLSEKGEIRLQYFLLFVNQTRAASTPPLSPHPQRKREGGGESIASVGCFTVVLLISSSWWLSLICCWHRLQSACCIALAGQRVWAAPHSLQSKCKFPRGKMCWGVRITHTHTSSFLSSFYSVVGKY